MHPDLVAISNLWTVDSRIDTVRAEHEHLSAEAARATKAAQAATVALAAADARLQTLRDTERKNGRELSDYTERRDRTRAMIDGGSANYDTAVKQLAQLGQKVDELETVAIELLDAFDAAQRDLEAARAAAAAATDAVAAAKTALAARDAPIRAELGTLLVEREARFKEVPADHRVPYGELRRKKRRPLVNVSADVCVQCQIHVPPQRMVEVNAKRTVHVCPGCGAFLLPA